MGKIIRKITHNRQPFTWVIISDEKIVNNKIEIDREKTTQPIIALLDTGANHSSISQKIVDELKLIPTTKIQVNSSTHCNQESYLYKVVIGISLNERPIIHPKNGKIIINEWMAIPITVSCSPGIEKQGFDVIIGMDIIMEGHLTVSEGAFIFSI